MKNRFSFAFVALLTQAACQDSSVSSGTGAAPPPPPATHRAADPALVARGSEVYRKNCASCHGGVAQGAPNWQSPGADGKYPPPPLNGSGHAWHHPRAALKMTIRDGTIRLGGSMPAWGDKLPDQDIDAVIAWMQSLWPAEIYQAWLAMDEKSRRGNSAH